MDILESLNNVLTITGSFGAIYSAWSWWRQRKRDKALDARITIRFCDRGSGKAFHTLNVRPARRTISRAEVLGYAGMVPTKEGAKEGKRFFTCAYTVSKDFIDGIEQVYEGKADVINIFFTEAEKAVFDLPTSA